MPVHLHGCGDHVLPCKTGEVNSFAFNLSPIPGVVGQTALHCGLHPGVHPGAPPLNSFGTTCGLLRSDAASAFWSEGLSSPAIELNEDNGQNADVSVKALIKELGDSTGPRAPMQPLRALDGTGLPGAKLPSGQAGDRPAPSNLLLSSCWQLSAQTASADRPCPQITGDGSWTEVKALGPSNLSGRLLFPKLLELRQRGSPAL